MKTTINWFCLVAIICMLLFAAFGCRTIKEVEVTKEVLKTDSSVVKTRDSLRAQLTKQRINYERQIRDLKKTGVKFDNPCPETKIPENCDKDSMAKIIKEKDALISTFKNKVTISENGRIEAEGRISSANFSQEQLQQYNYQLEQTIHELSQTRDSLVTALKTEKEASSKVKNVKRIFPLWLLLIVFAAGFLIRHFIPHIKLSNMKSFAWLLLLPLLGGCAKFKDGGESVWQAGMWLIPVLLFSGAIYFFTKAWMSSKSNSTVRSLKGFYDNTGNVPIYKHGFFWFSAALVVAAIVVIIVQNSSK